MNFIDHEPFPESLSQLAFDEILLKKFLYDHKNFALYPCKLQAFLF